MLTHTHQNTKASSVSEVCCAEHTFEHVHIHAVCAFCSYSAQQEVFQEREVYQAYTILYKYNECSAAGTLVTYECDTLGTCIYIRTRFTVVIANHSHIQVLFI